jgi:hypothetical protein
VQLAGTLAGIAAKQDLMFARLKEIEGGKSKGKNVLHVEDLGEKSKWKHGSQESSSLRQDSSSERLKRPPRTGSLPGTESEAAKVRGRPHVSVSERIEPDERQPSPTSEVVAIADAGEPSGVDATVPVSGVETACSASSSAAPPACASDEPSAGGALPGERSERSERTQRLSPGRRSVVDARRPAGSTILREVRR